MSQPTTVKADNVRALLRHGGYSYVEIARIVGLSSSRVYQIAKSLDIDSEPPFTLAAAARKWGCNESTVARMIRNGVVSAVKLGGRWHVLRDWNPRRCLTCGEPIESGRSRYCSQEHYEEAAKESRRKSAWRSLRIGAISEERISRVSLLEGYRKRAGK